MNNSSTVYSNTLLERSFSRPVAFLEQARAWIVGPQSARTLTENPGTISFHDYGCRPSLSVEFRKNALLFGRCDDFGMALGKVSEIAQKTPRSKLNLQEAVEELIHGLPPVFTFNAIITQDAPTAITEILSICMRIQELSQRISNYQVDCCCRLITLKLDDNVLRNPLPISHFQLDSLKHQLEITPPIHLRRHMNFRQFDAMLNKDIHDWLIPSQEFCCSSSIYLSLAVTSTPFGIVYAQAEKSLRHHKTSLGVKTIVKLFEAMDTILSNVDQVDLKISCSFQIDSYDDVVRVITTKFSHRLPNTSGHCFCGFTSSCKTYHYVYNDDLYRIFLHRDRANWLLVMSKVKGNNEMRFRMEQMAILSSLDRQSVSLGFIEMWKSFYLYMCKQDKHCGVTSSCRFSQNDHQTYLMKPTVRRCNSCSDEKLSSCIKIISKKSERTPLRKRYSVNEERLLHPLRDYSTAIGPHFHKKSVWNEQNTDKLRLGYCRLLSFGILPDGGNTLRLDISTATQEEKKSLKLPKTDIRQFFQENCTTQERFVQENIKALCQPIRRITIDPFCLPPKIVRDIMKYDLRTHPSVELVQFNFTEIEGSQKELRIFEAFPIKLVEVYDHASFHICRYYSPRRLTKFLEENPDLSDYWFIPIRPRSYNYLSIFVNANFPKAWFPQLGTASRSLRLLEYLVFPIGQVMRCLPLLLKSISFFYFEIDEIPSFHIIAVLSQYLVLNLRWEEDSNIYSGFRRIYHRRIYNEMFVLTIEPTSTEVGQYRLFIHRKNEDFRILQYLRSNGTSSPPSKRASRVRTEKHV